MSAPGAGPAAPLEVRGVTLRYGRRVALDGLDLEVPPATVLALLGPNGAGKTTLVGLAAGLLAPDAGTVRVSGRDPRSGRPEDRRLVGLAAQDVALYPGLSVRDNLRAFGEVAGLSRRDARARVAELAGPFSLDGLLERRVAQLSGGEQRRLHAAIALVHRPPLVLLDEPTAGADVQTRDGILAAVRALAAEGTSVLYTTHYLPEVEQLDALVAVMQRGRTVATGTVAELVADHAEPAVELELGTPEAAAEVAAALPGASREATVVRVPCARPEEAVAGLLAGLAGRLGDLRAVTVVRPSLEAVYLRLTGRRRLDGDGDDGGEGAPAPGDGDVRAA